MSKDDQMIFAVLTDDLFPSNNYFSGYVSDHLFRMYQPSSQNLRHHFWRRGDIENNPGYKQIIPYFAVYNFDTHKFLGYVRSDKSGESRLHRKLSFGFGGHIEESELLKEEDYCLALIHRSAEREAKEELGLENIHDKFFHFGYINDDSNSVGQVHFAYVMILSLSKYKLEHCCDEVEKYGWYDLSEPGMLLDDDIEVERWTELLIPALRRYDLRRKEMEA